MNRPAARAVITTALLRYVVSLTATAALLAGCGGSQSPLSIAPQGLATQQSHAEATYDILHSFGLSKRDATNPAADLINVNGTLYSTTRYGGSHNAGTVFSLTKAGDVTVLHSFGPGDGGCPVARLLNVKGTLYGTTSCGGTNGGGTVFSITLNGTEKVLHNFDSDYYSYDRNNGTMPVAGLINVNGTLYGTTERGGVGTCGVGHSCGTVFSITTNGTYKVLHRFGINDGAFPEAALLDVNGTLYGTTFDGGAKGGRAGTVFSITTAGKERVVYSFGTNQNDGGFPAAPLIDVNGTLYGTASGYDSGGAVFSVTTDGTEKTLNFENGGSLPLAGLTDVKGVLYGTTALGGAKNRGTVFSITTSGEEKVLHSFRAGSGVNPVAGLLNVDGTLYGTTYGALGQFHGNVFTIKP
jgi:uncharacterized repeat protein (TIGR03803 family)